MATDPAITLQTLPEAAIDCTAVEAWLAGAEPGDSLVYAWGRTPPRQYAAWTRARELSDEREVRLHDRRRLDGRTREWYMVKRRPEPGEQPVAISTSEGEAESEDAAVLRILRRAVNLQLACPTNAEIGRQCDITTRQAAYRIELLVKAGSIMLEPQGPKLRRILTIGGRSTPGGSL